MGAECAEVIDESSRFIVKSYYRINSGENEGKFDERITILSNQK